VRVVELTATFRKTRAVHAPIGSPADLAVRAAIRQLASERYPIPGRKDREAFRTPVDTCWMREVTGTNLVLHYTFMPPVVRILAVLESM
jgi:hypothetical protein